MDREAERRRFSRVIAKLLTHADYRSAMSSGSESSIHNIIVALPDDTMGSVYEQMENRGGYATLATFDEQGLMLLRGEPSGAPDSEGSGILDYLPVGASAEVGMFVAFMRRAHGRVRVEVTPSTDMQLSVLYTDDKDGDLLSL